MSEYKNSHNEIAIFYQEQLKKFRKLGIGNKTEFNTVVTSQLIDSTQKRLNVLQKKTNNYANRSVCEQEKINNVQ